MYRSKIFAVTFALAGAALWAAAQPVFELNENWCKPPAGKETIGDAHGEIRMDRAGNVYVSLDDDSETGRIQVFAPDGRYLKSIGVPGIHGFVIHDDGGTEYIYAAHLAGKSVLKLALDGTVAMEIPASRFPTDKLGERGLRVTSVDVGPDGHIYAVDGYGLDWIYRFDASGAYVDRFGGQSEPFGLDNCHKIFVDPRYDPPRLLLTDRDHGRLVHATLDGELIGTYAENLRRPSSAAFHGDWVAIAEIKGRVTLLDKDGKVVTHLGTNETEGLINTNKTQPKDWQPGLFTSPHGIGFDAEGNLYVSEWNKFGRVLRFDLVKP